MQHPIGIAPLAAAAVAYALGWGPLVFGTPFLGAVLLLAGAGLEIGFWRGRRRVVVAAGA